MKCYRAHQCMNYIEWARECTCDTKTMFENHFKGQTMKPPFIRTPYNYDRMEVSNETGLECKDESRTSQAGKEEADINLIVERFLKTGELPLTKSVPQSADFDEIYDYKSAMNIVVAGREAFDELPAHVRYRFHNNPAEFLDFVHTEGNEAELEKLGLRTPKPPEKAVVPPLEPKGDT